MGFRIRDWHKLQHFKDRRPPWLKLYREDVLDDPDWHELDGDMAKALIMITALASEDKDLEGKLPDVRTMAFRLRISETKLNYTLTKLSKWVIQDDIRQISERYQVDAPETETETETETDILSTLPTPKIDPAARAAEKLNGKRAMIDEVMAYMNLQARRNYRAVNPNGTYTAHADVIYQRLKEGYTPRQLKDVIGCKSGQWMGDEKMDKYLNPETLFRKTNFVKYLAEAEAE